MFSHSRKVISTIILSIGLSQLAHSHDLLIMPYCKNDGHLGTPEIKKYIEKNSAIFKAGSFGRYISHININLKAAYINADVKGMKEYINKFILAHNHSMANYSAEYMVSPFLVADYLDDLVALELIYSYFKFNPASIQLLKDRIRFHSTLYNSLLLLPYLEAKIALLKGNAQHFRQNFSAIELHSDYIRRLTGIIEDDTKKGALNPQWDEYARMNFMYFQLLFAGRKKGFVRTEKWPKFSFDFVYKKVASTCSNRLKVFAAIMRDAPEGSVETVTQKIKQGIPDVPILALIAEKWMGVLGK